MLDLNTIARLRESMRVDLGLRIGYPITDEMLSAAIATLAEVWTLRIFCSPEKHTSLNIVELTKKITVGITNVLMEQAKEMLPHAVTYSISHEPPPKA